MARQLRRRLTFANVCSLLALVVALGTGSAYAANTIGSSDIIDESIQSVDIKNGEVRQGDSNDGGVTFNVGGAHVGDSPIVTTRAAIQNGIVLYPNRVASTGHVEVNACNFTGTSMTPISSFPVRIITLR